MKAVAIVGSSDTGKTSLIEALVPRLDGRVATVKSIHHALEIDNPGTDTYRHRMAGAETVVGVAPTLTFTIEPTGKDDSPTDWPALRRVLSGLELDGINTVLVEGFTASPIPKVVLGQSPDSLEGDVIERMTDVGATNIDAITSTIDGVEDWSAYEP